MKTYSEQLLTAIQKNDFSQNRILLRKALAHDDENTLAKLAASLSDLGLTDLAQEIYRALLKKDPDNGFYKVYLSEILLNDGQDDEALSLLYDVKPEDDAYLASLLASADYYEANGLVETAAAKLDQARKLAPHEPAVIFGQAELAYENGDYQTALPLYRQLAKKRRAVAEVSLNQRLISCLANLGDYEEAAKLLRQDQDSIVSIDDRYQAGVIWLAAGDNKQAIKYFDSVLEQSPDYVSVYPRLAEAYAKEHDQNNALQTALTGLSYDQYNGRLYALAAQVAANLGQEEQAEDLLTKGLKQLPDDNSLRLQLSNLFLHQGRDEDNVDLLAELPDDDKEPQVYWNLALSQLHLEKLAEAKANFLLAYPAYKDNPDFLKNFIELLQAQGDTQTLKILVQDYLKLVPDDPDMQDLLNRLQ
jgi:tetratricopeptide (TPR) repeat protein